MRKLVLDPLSADNRNELLRTMLDVLRVLVVNRGTSWRSELVQDLGPLYEFRGELKAADKSTLDRVLTELGRAGLVRVEKRTRGVLTGSKGEKDELLSLTDYVEIRNALSKDRMFMSYICSRVAGVKI